MSSDSDESEQYPDYLSDYDGSAFEIESSLSPLSAPSSIEDMDRRAERNMLIFGYNPDLDNDSVPSISPVSPTEHLNYFHFHNLVERPAEQYDTNLTPIHTYLGRGLRVNPNRTIFEDDVIYTIPVMFLKVNLVPGQILPIFARSVHAKLVLKYALEHNNCFGVSYKLNKNEPTYGTTADIYEHSQQLQFSQSLVIKSIGQQRFEILSVDQFPGDVEPDPDQPSVALAQIKIVSDIVLLNSANELCAMNHHVASRCNVCRKKKMLETQWPTWVYNQFDANQLASRVLEKAKMLYKELSFSNDPYLLSMQVTRLGIFSHKQVNTMLGLKSTNQRLQHQLEYWNRKQLVQKFICAHPGCNTPICNTSNVNPMSPDGPQGIYCNAWGNVHDLITVTHLDNPNVVISGEPSSECTWFPGYNWELILCPNCDQHWGWRYVTDSLLSLEPHVFYGLSLRAIRSEISASNRDDAMDID